MSADTAAYGTQRDDGVAGDPAVGSTVYHSFCSERVEQQDGQYQVFIHVTTGRVEQIGDRPMVRHGAVYEDLDDTWHSTEAAARAAQAQVIRDIAGGLLQQADRLSEVAT